MKSKTENAEKLFATLVRGQSYVLVDRNGGPDLNFLHGQPLEVTAAQRDHLQVHGVDRVTVLDLDTDDIVPMNGSAHLAGVGPTKSRDVAKFKFSVVSEAEKAS